MITTYAICHVRLTPQAGLRLTHDRYVSLQQYLSEMNWSAVTACTLAGDQQPRAVEELRAQLVRLLQAQCLLPPPDGCVEFNLIWGDQYGYTPSHYYPLYEPA